SLGPSRRTPGRSRQGRGRSVLDLTPSTGRHSATGSGLGTPSRGCSASGTRRRPSMWRGRKAASTRRQSTIAAGRGAPTAEPGGPSPVWDRRRDMRQIDAFEATLKLLKEKGMDRCWFGKPEECSYLHFAEMLGEMK